MIVRSGRGGGHTTQMFINILATDKDALVYCRNASVMHHLFIKMFPNFVKKMHLGTKSLVLIDDRKVKFVGVGSSYNHIDFDGDIFKDE